MEPSRHPDLDAGVREGTAACGPAEGDEVIPVIEETLRVDKVATDQGGYRVSKRVELREEIVEEELLRDEVRIERRPVGETLPAGSSPAPYYDGDTLVIPVLTETVVVEKRLLLVEEVRISRRPVKERSRQPVTLRAERIEIERLDAEPASEPHERGPRGQANQPPRGHSSEE
jgi:uncharacterized protein (TIGR02271 family)